MYTYVRMHTSTYDGNGFLSEPLDCSAALMANDRQMQHQHTDMDTWMLLVRIMATDMVIAP